MEFNQICFSRKYNICTFNLSELITDKMDISMISNINIYFNTMYNYLMEVESISKYITSNNINYQSWKDKTLKDYFETENEMIYQRLLEDKNICINEKILNNKSVLFTLLNIVRNGIKYINRFGVFLEKSSNDCCIIIELKYLTKRSFFYHQETEGFSNEYLKDRADYIENISDILQSNKIKSIILANAIDPLDYPELFLFKLRYNMLVLDNKVKDNNEDNNIDVDFTAPIFVYGFDDETQEELPPEDNKQPEEPEPDGTGTDKDEPLDKEPTDEDPNIKETGSVLL